MTEHLFYLGTAILVAVTILASSLLFNQSEMVELSLKDDGSYQVYAQTTARRN